MGSQLDIANQVLSLVGVEPISAFEQEYSEAARQMRLHFNSSRDEMLSKYRWNFAKKFTIINPLSDFSCGCYGSAYQLPNDCIIVRDISNYSNIWERIEGNILLSYSSGPIELSYTSSDISAETWPAIFLETFKYYLASKIAAKLTGSQSSAMKFDKIADEKLQKAKHKDAMEGQTSHQPIGWYDRTSLPYA